MEVRSGNAEEVITVSIGTFMMRNPEKKTFQSLNALKPLCRRQLYAYRSSRCADDSRARVTLGRCADDSRTCVARVTTVRGRRTVGPRNLGSCMISLAASVVYVVWSSLSSQHTCTPIYLKYRHCCCCCCCRRRRRRRRRCCCYYYYYYYRYSCCH